MEACTFKYGIVNSDKTVPESLDIADDVFLLIARGKGLDLKICLIIKIKKKTSNTRRAS